jgi:integrase
LEKFAAAFPCNISDVSAVQIQEWLDGQKLSAQSYQNNRRVVNTLFNFAMDKKRRYVRDNVVDDVDEVDIDEREPEIFTPDEARSLMANASEDFLPQMAIGLFAGVRSAEIQRLTWDKIDFKERHIILKAGVAKTGARRIVPMHDNLFEWLAPYADKKGKLWEFTDDAFDKRLAATAKAAGIEWKHNAPRHSFISYAFAATDDEAKVASWAGNSPKMIQKHYRKLVTKAEAQKYFAIHPPKLVGGSVPSVPMLT